MPITFAPQGQNPLHDAIMAGAGAVGQRFSPEGRAYANFIREPGQWVNQDTGQLLRGAPLSVRRAFREGEYSVNQDKAGNFQAVAGNGGFAPEINRNFIGRAGAALVNRVQPTNELLATANAFSGGNGMMDRFRNAQANNAPKMPSPMQQMVGPTQPMPNTFAPAQGGGPSPMQMSKGPAPSPMQFNGTGHPFMAQAPQFQQPQFQQMLQEMFMRSIGTPMQTPISRETGGPVDKPTRSELSDFLAVMNADRGGIPVVAHPGEFVLNANAVKAIGEDRLEAFNNQFNTGGGIEMQGGLPHAQEGGWLSPEVQALSDGGGGGQDRRTRLYAELIAPMIVEEIMRAEQEAMGTPIQGRPEMERQLNVPLGAAQAANPALSPSNANVGRTIGAGGPPTMDPRNPAPRTPLSPGPSPYSTVDTSANPSNAHERFRLAGPAPVAPQEGGITQEEVAAIDQMIRASGRPGDWLQGKAENFTMDPMGDAGWSERDQIMAMNAIQGQAHYDQWAGRGPNPPLFFGQPLPNAGDDGHRVENTERQDPFTVPVRDERPPVTPQPVPPLPPVTPDPTPDPDPAPPRKPKEQREGAAAEETPATTPEKAVSGGQGYQTPQNVPLGSRVDIDWRALERMTPGEARDYLESVARAESTAGIYENLGFMPDQRARESGLLGQYQGIAQEQGQQLNNIYSTNTMDARVRQQEFAARQGNLNNIVSALTTPATVTAGELGNQATQLQIAQSRELFPLQTQYLEAQINELNRRVPGSADNAINMLQALGFDLGDLVTAQANRESTNSLIMQRTFDSLTQAAQDESMPEDQRKIAQYTLSFLNNPTLLTSAGVGEGTIGRSVFAGLGIRTEGFRGRELDLSVEDQALIRQARDAALHFQQNMSSVDNLLEPLRRMYGYDSEPERAQPSETSGQGGGSSWEQENSRIIHAR